MMSQSHVQVQQGGLYYRGDSGAMSNGVNASAGINASTGAGGVTLQQQQDFVNALISVLEVPKDATSVASVYANDKNTASEVQAYAKIAGKDWTYYLKDIVINIGRNTSPGDTSVNIDLGPAKVVSRQHATIKFNSNSALWELHVTGRNGAKVNFHRINSGPQSVPHPLSSGSILDIGGTQMMFILPDQGLFIDPDAVANLTPKLFMAYYNVTTNPLLRNLFQSNPELASSLESTFPNRNNTVGGNSSQSQMMVQSSQPHLHDSNGNQPSVRAFKMYDAPDSAMRSQGLSEPLGQMYGSNDGSNGHEMSHSNGSSDMSNGQLYGTIANTGFSIASTDVSTDLSRDENRNIKPPHSYATMITQAILSTEEGELSLSDIYKHIANNYSYYRYTKAGWQNSIRHNLSLNKAFEKVPRKPGEPGKGMKWRISEETQRDFLEKWQTGKIGKVRRGSSVTRQLQAHMYRFNSLPIQRETFSFNDQSQTNGKQQSSSHMQNNQTPKLEKSLQSLPPQSQSPLRQTSPLLHHSSMASYPQQNQGNSNFADNQSQQSDLPPAKRQHVSPPPQHSQPQQLNHLPPPSSVQNRSPTHQQVPSNGSSTGSLLHSPNKHFQVNAVEAYTPDRGSNVQKSPQPMLNLPPLPQTAEMGHSTSRSDSMNLPLPQKSSPGVMNLLQFSSVNNTPSTNLQRTPLSHPQVSENLDGKNGKPNMLALNNAFQESNTNNKNEKANMLSARDIHDENEEDEAGIMSSPIKVNDNRKNLLVVDSNDNKVVVKSDQ
ncbi:unnamed protein product [Kluyveromyces dobzhanskii CBS 2104]|uniref:WGS project CCBQ000000000 data, contig 00015 n=1 Tax=Kluyveromyces dobzhanskii CBS 2104 TaxID=1427455 RepID=A0A0A8L9D3_9SACH|nr:unnamed protein product [Kluyveromyces dobzhanskii CBS 2104]